MENYEIRDLASEIKVAETGKTVLDAFEEVTKKINEKAKTEIEVETIMKIALAYEAPTLASSFMEAGIESGEIVHTDFPEDDDLEIMYEKVRCLLETTLPGNPDFTVKETMQIALRQSLIGIELAIPQIIMTLIEKNVK